MAYCLREDNPMDILFIALSVALVGGSLALIRLFERL